MPNLAATITVGNHPLRMVAGTYVYALNVADGTISRIDPATNNVVATLSLGGVFIDFAIAAASFFAVDTLGNVSHFDVAGNFLSSQSDNFTAPIFSDGTYVWCARSTGNTVGRFTAASFGAPTNLSLGTPPAGTSYQAAGFVNDGTNMWISVNNVGGTAHKLLKCNPATPAILSTFSAAAWSAYYHGIDYDTTNGFVWVVGNDQKLRKINPSTGAVVSTISAAAASANVAFESTSPGVWNDHQSTAVYRYDPLTGALNATISGLDNLTRVWCFAYGSIWASSSHGTEVYRISGLGPPLSAPTVVSIAANTGPTAGGTPVTITGTNFVNGATVAIGGNACSSVVWVSSTSITAVTPANLTAGAYDVVVTNPDTQQGILPGGFTYTVQTPSVLICSPSSGITTGGTLCTITGTSFVLATTVTFGGNPATNVSVTSSSTLTCMTPAGAAGLVNIVATNPGPVTGTLVNGFNYLPLPPIPPASSRWNAGNAIVGVIHVRQSTYVVLSNANGALTKTLLYDMERKIWLPTSMGVVAMTQELYGGSLAFFYGRADGTIVQGFTATVPNYGATPQIQTVFMSPPGKGRQDWAIFQGLHLYGTQQAGIGGVSASIAADDGAPIPLVLSTDTFATLQQGIDDVFLIPQGQVPRGRLFRITISWPGNDGEALSSFEGVWTLDVDPKSAGGVP